MKKQKNKIAAITIAMFFIFSMIASTILISTADAAPVTVPTNAYVSVTPGTIGVNQTTTIVVFLDRYSPTSGGENGQQWEGFLITIQKPDGTNTTIGPFTCASAVASDFKTFTPTEVGNYTIQFSWPGGIVKPSEATYATSNAGDIFLGATSKPCYLTVQQDPVPLWPETPVPTDYWTLPVNGQNRAWNTASNWLQGTWLTNNFQTSGTGPKTAHVLWTAPIMATSPSTLGYPGGIADAKWPGMSNNINDYESAYRGAIIMNGVIYYNAPTTEQSDKYGYYAVDLYSGQRLWYKNGTDNGLENPYSISQPSSVSTSPSYAEQFYILTCGQLYHYSSVNGQGVASFLWMQQQASTTFTTAQTTWYLLDSTTGNVILTMKNVPSGTSATDQDGSLLVYSYSSAKGQFLCWNSSQAIYPGGATSSGAQVFRPSVGAIIDAINDTAWVNASTTWGSTFDPNLKEALKTPHSGYTMNVTSDSLKNLPAASQAGAPGTTVTGAMKILQDDKGVPKQIFGSSVTTTYTSIGGSCCGDTIGVCLIDINDHATAYSPWPGLPSCVNNNLGYTLTLNYNKTFTVPLPGKNYTWSISTVDYDSGIFLLRCAQTGQLWAYSLETGDLKWGPTPVMTANDQFAYYGQSTNVYYGIILVCGQYPGTIDAYEATTGQFLWTYDASAAPYAYESAYGSNMPLTIGAVCDGMIYTYSTEHSPTNPLWRQSYVRCINITDGTLVWKLEDFVMSMGIADGYLVSASQYDNLIYTIGKGPSAITVAAPQSGVSQGSRFAITGTVTDQSPGAKAYATKFGLLNGVPAVSDESQEALMEFLYEQQPEPTNATGVTVKIDAIDPNGNFVNLGETTSDSNGFYCFQANPDMLSAGAGTYKIIATFAGSQSYGSSTALAAFTVNAQTTATPTTVSQQNVATTADLVTYLALGVTAIIIAIAVVGVLLLRKHQ
jgi:hypothetical protein